MTFDKPKSLKNHLPKKVSVYHWAYHFLETLRLVLTYKTQKKILKSCKKCRDGFFSDGKRHVISKAMLEGVGRGNPNREMPHFSFWLKSMDKKSFENETQNTPLVFSGVWFFCYTFLFICKRLKNYNMVCHFDFTNCFVSYS